MILKKHPQFNYYDPVNQMYDGEFANLAIFLTGDAFPIGYWFHFLENDGYKTVMADSTRVMKTEDNRIIISARWGFDDPDEDPMPFTITTDNFRQILDTWAQLIKQEVDEITITQDKNGLVVLKGKSIGIVSKCKSLYKPFF